MNRRDCLVALGGGASLAGRAALGGVGDSTNSGGESSGSDCRNARQRLDWDYNAQDDAAQGLGLSVTPESVVAGDGIAARLKNTTGEERTTADRRHYTIQRRVDGEWRDIFWVTPPATYTSEAITHEPGDGFEWTFPLTQDGLTTGKYHVCSPSNRERTASCISG